jgi:hypothetical protein
MLFAATPALAQTVTAMWDPSSPNVTDYHVCVGTSSFSCNVRLDTVSAASTSYTFAPTSGVQHFVAIRAANAAGVSPFSSEVNFSIPSFAQPPDQSSSVGAGIAPVSLSIADPDGSPLTITHTGLPVGLSVNSATRQITGTPTAAGTYNVTLSANDGLVTVSRSFTWTVGTPVPDITAPSLTITSHSSGQTVTAASVTIAGEATDSGTGGRGITSVSVNGLPAAGGTEYGNNIASWSRPITLATGVNTITVEATDGAGNQTMQQVSVTRSTQVCLSDADFNGDCKADLIWRNTATGQNLVWYLDGTTFLGLEGLPTLADPGWRLAASADFNQDGASDLIWRNPSSGQNVIWYLRGTTYLGYAVLPTLVGSAWQMVTSVDINRDGAPDLIWRNPSTGQNVVWYFSGTTYIGYGSLPALDGAAWQLAASADVNQDRAPDLIWHNDETGQNAIWYLNGLLVVGYTVLPTVSDVAWRLMTALDIDNDGATELIWRHEDGTNVVWYLDQTTLVGGGYLPTVSDETWQMIGAR